MINLNEAWAEGIVCEIAVTDKCGYNQDLIQL